jgi:TetR/AcrR family transcriptional regulator
MIEAEEAPIDTIRDRLGSDSPLAYLAQPEQRNRERIFLTAAGLFANKGYAGTPVREIVEAAGVTKPTLYYYFKNKEDLYIQLIDLAMTTFSWVLDHSASRTGTMRERLTGLFSDLYELFREYVYLLRLVNSMIYGPKGATPDYDFTVQSCHFEDVLRVMLEQGAREGELAEEAIGDVMLLLVGILRYMEEFLVLEPDRISFTSRDVRRILGRIFDGTRPCARMA